MSCHDYTVSFHGRLHKPEHVRELLAIVAAAGHADSLFVHQELDLYLSMSPDELLAQGKVLVEEGRDSLLIQAVSVDGCPEPVLELSFDFECTRSHGLLTDDLLQQSDLLDALMAGPALLTVTDNDVSPGSDDDIVHLYLGPSVEDRAKAVTDRLFGEVHDWLGPHGIDLGGVKAAFEALNPSLAAAMAKNEGLGVQAALAQTAA